jgi:outer membrane protein OmpA-like peptidoglycan-associated protein
MIGRPVVIRRKTKGEAEKPFWISYADLMTALMVLFLVAMSVAMMAVTNTVRDVERQKHELEVTNDRAEKQNSALETALNQVEADKAKLKDDEQELRAKNDELEKLKKSAEDIEAERVKKEREIEISALLDEVANAALRHPGVKVDKDQHTIDFGDRARFDMNSYALTPEQSKFLRAFVPEVLTIAKDKLGRKWLKQIVVEGFASPEGDYLYNLNLSLQRSQRVLCVLLTPPGSEETPLTVEQLEQIRDLFLVGGYSFNAVKFDEATKSYDASRRVELRLEFLNPKEKRPPAVAVPHDRFGECALH